MRYYVLLNADTLEVYVQEFENQPENSILFSETNFVKPVFDVYPRPTEIVEGATAEEILAHEREHIPQTISQMKLRMQLILSGISIASIYAAIDQIPDLTQRQIIYNQFEYADLFERNDATLNQMALMLGITQEQLDFIFSEGNLLK